MTIRILATLSTVVLSIVATHWSVSLGAQPDDIRPPVSVDEARGRARLLHEAMHATLHIVHREYYREDEALKIPAATMKRVFKELANRQQVELRWLAVNAQAMNADHKPRDAFEQQAVKVLASGKNEYEQIDDGVYRLASTITLSSDCLKCHAPHRNSNQDRAAALIISMSIAKKP